MVPTSHSSHASWIREFTPDHASIDVDTAIYPLEVLFRTCYIFTDRCYLFLSPGPEVGVISVSVSRKTSRGDLADLAGEFANELINQKLREDIAAETREIRELIVAQAFIEADLLGKERTDASYQEDPRGIAT